MYQVGNHFIVGGTEKFNCNKTKGKNEENKFMTKHQEIYCYKIKCEFIPTSLFSLDFNFRPSPLCTYDVYIQCQYSVLVFHA